MFSYLLIQVPKKILMYPETNKENKNFKRHVMCKVREFLESLQKTILKFFT